MFFFFLCLWITQKYKYGFDILNNSNCVPTTFYNIWFGNKKKSFYKYGPTSPQHDI